MQKELKFSQILFRGLDIIVITSIIIAKVLIQAELAWNTFKKSNFVIWNRKYFYRNLI